MTIKTVLAALLLATLAVSGAAAGSAVPQNITPATCQAYAVGQAPAVCARFMGNLIKRAASAGPVRAQPK